MGSSLQPDVRNEASNEILHQYLSAQKARTLLHWEPLFTLEQGLARAIAWYHQFFARRAARGAGRASGDTSPSGQDCASPLIGPSAAGEMT